MNRKICVVTGTRAEYGLLFWVINGLQQDSEVELQLVVTGMHLSPEFGLTYKQIEKDGFTITKKVEILLSSDTETGICKSIGLGILGFSEAFNELKPDLLVVLGDRFEIFSAVSAAMVFKIPVAHCHGGETTEGVIDEPIRHSITKMSHIHFTSTEEYRKRVIQLGENPGRVINVGALGIENINKITLLSKEELEESLSFRFGPRNFLVTFHPVTLENYTARDQFNELLVAFEELKDVKFIFTKANADTDGRIINAMIDEFVVRNSHTAVAFVSLGQLRYLSTLQYIDAVVGNSSSGLIEAPSFKVGTINIGDRQKGRIRASSVIDCQPMKDAILSAVNELESRSFVEMLRTVENPYGVNNPSETIIPILKKINLEGVVKKKFHDL